MDKILQYTDATGEVITVGCVGDLIIKDVDSDDTHSITMVNLNGTTEIHNFIGERSTRDEDR
jgi:hypothetical protein